MDGARVKDSTSRARVFLDTSALFAGIWSETGGARMILKLGESGAVDLWMGPQVLREIEGVVRKKAPEAMGFLALLLDRCGFRICQTAAEDLTERTRTLLSHPGDALVLAEAWTEGVDYFVTLDERHFLKNAALRKNLPFIPGSPGDFICWFRQRLICESGAKT